MDNNNEVKTEEKADENAEVKTEIKADENGGTKPEEKIAKPDDLSKFLRVARPPVWFALIAILLLLVGALIWGASYSFETKVDGFAVKTAEGAGYCFVLSDDMSKVVPGVTVRMGDQETSVVSVLESSAPAGILLSEYQLLQSGFQEDDLLFAVELEQAPVTDFAKCHLIVESVSPFDLLFQSTQ